MGKAHKADLVRPRGESCGSCQTFRRNAISPATGLGACAREEELGRKAGRKFSGGRWPGESCLSHVKAEGRRQA